MWISDGVGAINYGTSRCHSGRHLVETVFYMFFSDLGDGRARQRRPARPDQDCRRPDRPEAQEGRDQAGRQPQQDRQEGQAVELAADLGPEQEIHHPNLIYPGQKLLLPAKGEKVKHRPLPALDRDPVGFGAGRRRRLDGWPSASPAATGASAPATATPVPPVRPGHLACQLRHRLGPQRQPRRADPRRRARPSLPGLGRLARLLGQARPPLSIT